MKRSPKKPAANPRRSMPLAYRVPNPPPLFVGREGEVRRLGEVVLRGPVTVLCGEGGLGKSALTLYLLHRKFPDEVGNAVFISLRGSDPHEHVALNVTRALVRADGVSHFDWSEVIGSPDTLSALAIDLAEAGKRWVILDDLQHGDPDQVRAFLRQLARYARTSKWIATARAAPVGDELVGQIVELAPMNAADLSRLARALHPGLTAEAAREVAARAEGSPWKLRRMQAAPDHARTLDVTALSDATRTFLEALSLVQIPLSERVIGAIVAPPPEGLEALERQGLLERSGGGLRLHEIARDVLPRPADTAAWRSFRARAATALVREGEDASTLQALRLLLEAGEPEAAAALLAEAGRTLLEGGYAASLWGLLERAAHPAFETWRLRCAVELGGADVLAAVQSPSRPTAEDRYLWAKILHAKGQMQEASSLAAGVHDDARQAGDRMLAFRSGFLRAQCVGNQGALGEAIAALDALDPPTFVEEAERDAFRSMLFGLLVEPARALAFAAAARRRIPELPWPARGQIGHRVAHSYGFLGRLRDAVQTLDDALQEGRDGSARFDVGRAIRFVRMCLAVDSGDLDRARQELADLDPYVARASLMRPYMINAQNHVSYAAGDFDELDRRLPELLTDDPPAQLREEARSLGARVRILRREPPIAEEAIPTEAQGTVFGQAHRLYRLELSVRAGERLGSPALAFLDEPFPHPELGMIARVVRAETRLLAGDAEAALADVIAVIAAAEDHGFGVREAEVRQLQCDILGILGRSEALVAAVAVLDALAARLPSPRFTLAAALHRAVAADGSLDAAQLEALASAHRTAPDVALRARALLHVSATPTDALDRLVLAAFARRPRFRHPTLVSPSTPRDPAFRAGWGLDEAAEDVWLPDGRRVSLSAHPTSWKLLHGLASSGGSATKEALVLDVWSEREYHPLRHDNRLQAAVRKLRIQIEDDPSRPTRVVTTDDGYALGGVVRFLRAAR